MDNKSSKLTLLVDSSVIRRAKSYALSHNTSVSTLVEAYLERLTAEDNTELSEAPDSWPPLTRSLFGALNKMDGEDIDRDELKRRYLVEKYLHD